MIESFDGVEIGRGMAIGALLRCRQMVRCHAGCARPVMTGPAFLRRALEDSVHMAGFALHSAMGAGEGKLCLVVIEIGQGGGRKSHRHENANESGSHQMNGATCDPNRRALTYTVMHALVSKFAGPNAKESREILPRLRKRQESVQLFLLNKIFEIRNGCAGCGMNP